MKTAWHPLITPFLKRKVKLPNIGDKVIVTNCYIDYQTYAVYTGENFVEIATCKPVGATHWLERPKSPVKTIIPPYKLMEM